jgi:hypothetical protein
VARPKSWPEGLSDAEAIQRFETLCLGGCDGVQDLADDARYKALRKALLARDDLRPLAPSFIAAQANIASFVRHVRETKDRSKRREMVRREFGALQDRVRETGARNSSDWTGRTTAQQQAAIVKALAPAALDAVQKLIDDEERSRGNGGPIDPDRDLALAQLKALHTALGELISLAKHDRPIEAILVRLREIGDAAKGTMANFTGALPITTSAMVAFSTVVGISEFFVGNVVLSVAAGALAGNTVKDVMLKKGEAGRT